MKKLLTTLLIAAVFATAITLRAQEDATPKADTNAPAAVKKEKDRLFWNGKLTAMDKKAQTITIKKKDAEKTFLVTSKTKIRKNGEEADFGDGVIGEDASASYHKGDTNAPIKAISVRYGLSDKQRAEQDAGNTNKTDTAKP
jgi:hypothetical protein